MMQIDRRHLLASGACLSAAAWLGRQARAHAPDGAEHWAKGAGDIDAGARRETMRFDFGWKFRLGHGSDPAKDLGFGSGQSDFSKAGIFGFAQLDFDDSGWRTLDLPHDWAVELPFVHDDTGAGDSQLRSHGYKPIGRRYPENSVGWYRRAFDIPASDRGRRIVVEFDGAFRDVLVFVNGCFIGRNTNCYTPFGFDLSDYLAYGATNHIVVRVDAAFGDGWFYEGAGIYRHVWLTKTDAVHLGQWDSTVRTTLNGASASLALGTHVANDGTTDAMAKVAWTISDATGTTVAMAQTGEQRVPAGGRVAFDTSAMLANPELWSIGHPYCYTALVSVIVDGKARDGERIAFGARTAVFDADKGFLLNGLPVRIQGTCNHQDHAGVGAALPDRLQQFRLGVLRDMGCNAVRTSHNMPTPEWVDACDRMGVMMMCETRLMGSTPEGLAQLDTMIRRYRNSPSIILWSIGNEEFVLQDKMAEQGARIAATMVRRCHALDPTRPVTAAANFDNEKGVSEPLDVIGFNYNQWVLDGFHKKHPTRPIMGSETSSAISTRGEYATDPRRNLINSYDGVVDWGQTPEAWWKIYGTRGWASGGFAWTGFDYRGEPTPYGWPSISSQFGVIDMCGFPKDYYYYYKAWWRKEPALHVFPHWNWQGKDNQDVAVWAYSNLDEVELFVNGQSQGRQKVPDLGHVAWAVKYQPGQIAAIGYRNGRRVLVQTRETTGPAETLRLVADRAEIGADGQDIAIITVDVTDRQGRAVPTANDRIAFKVSGAGKLIGVGNGDPNCLESDKGATRSLFNGLAQIIVQATRQAGTIRIEAVSDGGQPLESAVQLIQTRQSGRRPTVP